MHLFFLSFNYLRKALKNEFSAMDALLLLCKHDATVSIMLSQSFSPLLYATIKLSNKFLQSNLTY